MRRNKVSGQVGVVRDGAADAGGADLVAIGLVGDRWLPRRGADNPGPWLDRPQPLRGKERSGSVRSAALLNKSVN